MSLALSDPPTSSTWRSAADIRSYLIAALSRELKVDAAAIDPNAPLEDLGVDSLMALGMAGGLAAWLDRDVPATLMWDYPTIDKMADALAQGKNTPQLPSGIVRLQHEGDGVPIFCFPGLAGTPMAFMSLAAKLGPGHKVYGVAVPGYDGTSNFFTSVEEIAAAMLRAIRQVRPTGPYMLAGYCFGGFLAFEVAQQLVSVGETVSLLAIYDAFTASGRTPRPRWQRPFVHAYLLATRKTRLKDLLGKLKLSRFQTKPSTPAPEYWIKQTPSDSDPGRIIWSVNSAAIAKYSPRPYSGSVIWFRATERDIYNPFYKSMRCGGWSALAKGGVTTVTIPGDHGNLIGPEHATTAAIALRRYIVDSNLPQDQCQQPK